MGNVAWVIGTVVVLGGLSALAFWMEPHWASKDGRRFICRARLIGDPTEPAGRWREVRGHIDGDQVVVRARSPFGGAMTGQWSVQARGDMDRRKRHVYLLTRNADNQRLALRVPDNSRARPVFDDLVP